MMPGAGIDCVESVIEMLKASRDCAAILELLAAIDIRGLPCASLRSLIGAIATYSKSAGGPILTLSLPRNIQAEMVLFGEVCIPGIDHNAYLHATPSQVMRFLASGGDANEIPDYPFESFSKEDWKLYFGSCGQIVPAARAFLVKSESAGGFSDLEMTHVLSVNPKLIEIVSVSRLSPNTVLALLIARRADRLWNEYDFSRFELQHWRELFLHTNPTRLPKECEQFLKNDGNGFSPDELLTMATSCHALINWLDPELVPFRLAYDLYLTGRADVLWKNFPFATLDRAEWRKILQNPDIVIPEYFHSVAKSGRFKGGELVELAVKNPRLFPFIIDAVLTPADIVDLLLRCPADPIWEKYDFEKLSAADWGRLILSLGRMVEPRAFEALKKVEGITEDQATRIVFNDWRYYSCFKTSLLSSDVAVYLLVKGVAQELWDTYPFERLSGKQWLKLLTETTHRLPQNGVESFREHARELDSASLNALVLARPDVAEYVELGLFADETILRVMHANPEHYFWDVVDFGKFPKKQVVELLRDTMRVGAWPQPLVQCFKKERCIFNYSDLLEIAKRNPRVVAQLVDVDWLAELDDGLFGSLVKALSADTAGRAEIRQKLTCDGSPWNTLSREKLKSILKAIPSFKCLIDWKEWPYKDIADLVAASPEFTRELPHPVLFFIWKNWRWLLAAAALLSVTVVLLVCQYKKWQREEMLRQRRDSLVNTICKYSQSNRYGNLKSFLKDMSAEDYGSISNDTRVVRAINAIAAFEREERDNAERIKKLERLRGTEWQASFDEEARKIFAELKRSRVEIGSQYGAYKALLDGFESHVKADARAAKVRKLRAEIESISAECETYSALWEIDQAKQTIASMKEYYEINSECEDCARKLAQKGDEIRLREIRENVSFVSNTVEGVAIALQKKGAFAQARALKEKIANVHQLLDVEEYLKEHASRLEFVQECVDQLPVIMTDAKESKKKADDIKSRFANAFITTDWSSTCSNLIKRCKNGIANATKHGRITDAIEMYSNALKTVNVALEHDLKCWKAVDRLNASKTYDEYCKARSDLLRDFGSFKELEHLRNVGNVSLEAAKRKFYVSSGGSQKNATRPLNLRFVGVISLSPDKPGSVALTAKTKMIKDGTWYYTLEEVPSFAAEEVDVMPLHIRQQGGKFYRSGDFDYSLYTGCPLFIPEQDYIGGK